MMRTKDIKERSFPKLGIENCIFPLLNIDTSLDILCAYFKLYLYVLHAIMEGTLGLHCYYYHIALNLFTEE